MNNLSIGIQKAAQQGDQEAQNIIGEYYLDSTGVQQDEEKAVYWFKKSAEQGNSLAMFHLGECYYKGRGVTADTVIAIDWLKKLKRTEIKNAGRYWKQLYYDRSVMSIDRLLRLKPFNEYGKNETD